MFIQQARLYLALVISAAACVSALPSDTSNIASAMYANVATHTLQIKDEQYGVRNVSYFVTNDNNAVIDGDNVYPGGIDNLLAHAYTGEEDESVIDPRAFSLFRGTNTWPNATVTYKFYSDATQTQIGTLVTNALNAWKNQAPYLNFVRLANSATPMAGVLTITANPCNGCNANVGYYGGRYSLQMNLQQGCPGSGGVCGLAEATHEFGHVLGLHHEHERPDRENTIHYNCANLDPQCNNMPAGATCCGGYPSGCCRQQHNFDIQGGQDSSGPYDIYSIMQYRADAFAKPGTLTLTSAAPGIVVPVTNVQTLSALDVGRICKIYNTGGTC